MLGMKDRGKKSIALLILEREKARQKKEGSEYDAPEKEDSPSDPGMESAMEDFAKALRADDYAGMAQALCEFIHCHENSEEAGDRD